MRKILSIEISNHKTSC